MNTNLILFLLGKLFFLQALPFPGPGAAAGGGCAACTVSCTPPSSGMTLWFSADCTTFTSSVCSDPGINGTALSAWADHSGNANDMSLQAGSNMIWNSSSINSLPSVSITNSQMQLVSGIPASSGYSVFSVVQLNGTAKGDLLSQGPFGGGANFKYFFTTVQGVDSDSRVQIGLGTTSLGTTWHQTNATFVNNSSTINFRVDRATDPATAVSSANMTGSVKGVGSSGGATELLNAQVAELIFYNRVLSCAEIASVEGYFHTKYGL